MEELDMAFGKDIGNIFNQHVEKGLTLGKACEVFRSMVCAVLLNEIKKEEEIIIMLNSLHETDKKCVKEMIERGVNL